MKKAVGILASAFFLLATTSQATAQRYSDQSPCPNVVGGMCENNWYDLWFESYEECYYSNINACENQADSGTPGPFAVVDKYETCVSRSGIQLC